MPEQPRGSMPDADPADVIRWLLSELFAVTNGRPLDKLNWTKQSKAKVLVRAIDREICRWILS